TRRLSAGRDAVVPAAGPVRERPPGADLPGHGPRYARVLARSPRRTAAARPLTGLLYSVLLGVAGRGDARPQPRGGGCGVEPLGRRPDADAPSRPPRVEIRPGVPRGETGMRAGAPVGSGLIRSRA